MSVFLQFPAEIGEGRVQTLLADLVDYEDDVLEEACTKLRRTWSQGWAPKTADFIASCRAVIGDRRAAAARVERQLPGDTMTPAQAAQKLAELEAQPKPQSIPERLARQVLLVGLRNAMKRQRELPEEAR